MQLCRSILGLVVLTSCSCAVKLPAAPFMDAGLIPQNCRDQHDQCAQ